MNQDLNQDKGKGLRHSTMLLCLCMFQFKHARTEENTDILCNNSANNDHSPTKLGTDIVETLYFTPA